MQVEVIKLQYRAPYADIETELTISVAIPDLEQVHAFADNLHTQGKPWRGEYQGWLAYYTPEDRSHKPQNSKQEFYPAEFWIGTDHSWAFTLAWEDGAEQTPLTLESKYSR